MTEANMICRKIDETLDEINYVVLDAESFTRYGTVRYDFQNDKHRAIIIMPEDRRVPFCIEEFNTLNECLDWFKNCINREDYRHIRY